MFLVSVASESGIGAEARLDLTPIASQDATLFRSATATTHTRPDCPLGTAQVECGSTFGVG